MFFRRSDARLNQGWQHLILVGVSLSLAYLIAFLTLMDRWISFWLRGPYYLSYQTIFLTLLLFFSWFGCVDNLLGFPASQ
jgi:hypothetical protein